jgi:type III pantothenate kinase
MAHVLLDAGNSRLKWALARGGRLAAVGALAYTTPLRLEARLRRLLRSVGASERVLVACVAGQAVERAIRRAVRRAGLPAAVFVRSARRAGGVINAYDEPWRLGVDRWVALIGARARYPRAALCLASVGTALTLDLLDADGRHRGGAIAPGPALMVRALLERTAGIRRRAAGGRSRRGALFARGTRAAIEAGARYACAALIERAVIEGAARLGRRPMLLLAGGGAASLARLLRVPRRRADDLVMRGLLVLAAGGASRRRAQ